MYNMKYIYIYIMFLCSKSGCVQKRALLVLVGDDFHKRNSLVSTSVEDAFTIPTLVGYIHLHHML